MIIIYNHYSRRSLSKSKIILQFFCVPLHKSEVSMEEKVTKYRQLYITTRDAILIAPLTAAQLTTFKAQLADLKPVGLNGLAKKIGQAYLDLVSANLTYSSQQLIFVLNLNHDHSTIPLPLSAEQLQTWQKTQAPEYPLFTRNPFLYNGLSIDEVAAEALL